MSSADPSRRQASFLVLTPSSRGALAVIRVWGAGAEEILASTFRPSGGTGPVSLPRNAPRLGRLGGGEGDEVIAIATGEHPGQFEIHCHGGPAPIQLVTESLELAGAASATASEWLGSTSIMRIEREAWECLANTATFLCAEILLEQAQGALRRDILKILTQIESIDINQSNRDLEQLIARADLGIRLTSGWTLALAGRPNVGKSRLLNALAGYERSIVDEEAGTTRDVVRLRTALDGWPVEIADTAGLRASEDATEAGGIQLARDAHQQGDLVLLVLDLSRPLDASDLMIMAEHPQALLVANKSDLPRAWDPSFVTRTISAKTGEGIAPLAGLIAGRLVRDLPPPGAGVPFLKCHRDRLIGIQQQLANESCLAAADALRVWLGQR